MSTKKQSLQIYNEYRFKKTKTFLKTSVIKLLQYFFDYSRHIEEDTKVLTAEKISKMTPEELEFHYFSAHDFDKNTKLDGLELLKVYFLSSLLY